MTSTVVGNWDVSLTTYVRIKIYYNVIFSRKTSIHLLQSDGVMLRAVATERTVIPRTVHEVPGIVFEMVGCADDSFQ